MAMSKDEDNNTLCAAFWRHINVRSNNEIFPCCRYKQSVAKFTGDLAGILDYRIYENLRADSISGKFNPNCQKCYHEDSIGVKSLRQTFNEQYDIETVGLEFLEIGFDNICNLTCDGCNGEFSLAWADIERPDIATKSKLRSISPITSIPSSVNKILFLGGEPLMTTRHHELLNLVVDKSRVSVVYNTNGTFLLSQTTIDLLNKFKSVEFVISIDGYDRLNEQVRQGSKWSDVLEFIKQIKTLDFDLLVHTVLHMNNWQGIGDLWEFIQANQLRWRVNPLTYPKNLDIINLTADQRKKFIEIVNEIDLSDQNDFYNLNTIMAH
jgi:MoaA/NifB/PqqE/SkfB family radical SAM enzyme